MQQHGILLFAHGARDPLWARPFEAVARRLQDRAPDTPVVLAYLEFMSPDLRSAAHALAAQGCTAVSVLPLFLGAGGHVRKDLPALLDGVRGELPTVRWELAPAIGEIDSVVAAMADAAWALLQPPAR
ncbi:cobalamin biosynthesis protein CbiX [Methylibium sp. Pch-M]|uniref:sirohydrochlorin chelatase n=1 Tax=Methylibium sp. Pch-M TaxID=2082386 RepID=UPI00101033B3|nr:CbiX/SirB N-terminal domain-containing protein [Methylibium sp. Pch-M]QAZ41142.1 cobalamin biosynthesis protein CbiX [Methylibium sp. Pch-M]